MSKQKTIVIGIDAATWKVAQPLIEKGELPTIASLIKEGTHASLKSLPGYKSPALWTSIATGKAPEKNGVLYFSNLFLDIPKLNIKKDVTKNILVNWPSRIGKLVSKNKKDPSGFSVFSRKAYVYSMLKYGKALEKLNLGGNYLVTGAFRTEKTFWEILSEEGLTISTIGWLVTWPAEKTNGTIISQKAIEGLSKIYQNPHKFKQENQHGQVTYPQPLIEELKTFNRTPISLTDEELELFFTNLSEVETDQLRSMNFNRKNKYNFFSQLYLSDIFSTKAGIYIKEKYQPDFLTVYLPGLDGIQHIFWQYHNHNDFFFLNQPQQEIDKHGAVIDNYYKFLDQQIAALIQGFDNVIIVSDHGMESISQKHFDSKAIRSGQHEESPDGIVLLKGPHIKKNIKLAEAHIFDIAPTILYLLGKEIDTRMDGEILTEAITDQFRNKNSVRKKDYGKKKAVENQFYESEEQEEVKDRLKALGYLD